VDDAAAAKGVDPETLAGQVSAESFRLAAPSVSSLSDIRQVGGTHRMTRTYWPKDRPLSLPVDTNVLLAAADEADPDHHRCAACFRIIPALL
jgi:hypothetical protein